MRPSAWAGASVSTNLKHMKPFSPSGTTRLSKVMYLPSCYPSLKRGGTTQRSDSSATMVHPSIHAHLLLPIPRPAGGSSSQMTSAPLASMSIGMVSQGSGLVHLLGSIAMTCPAPSTAPQIGRRAYVCPSRQAHNAIHIP